MITPQVMGRAIGPLTTQGALQLRHPQRIVSVILLGLVVALPTLAQDPSSRAANEFVLHAEPLALGMSYTRSISHPWAAGLALSAGRHLGVTLNTSGFRGLDTWATSYLLLGVRVAPRFGFLVNPIGLALVAGNDFAVVYPSAGMGIQFLARRWRFSSDLRVIRIAGPNGTGEYWVQWRPFRLSLALT